jgi:hypothetical protein
MRFAQVKKVTKVTSLKGRQPFVLACTLASEPVLHAKVQSGEMTLKKKG